MLDESDVVVAVKDDELELRTVVPQPLMSVMTNVSTNTTQRNNRLDALE